MSHHRYESVVGLDDSHIHNGDNVTNNVTNNHSNITIELRQRAESIGIKHRSKILSWLSPLSFKATHEQIRDQAGLNDRGDDESESRDHDYTGKWLFESHPFTQWKERRIRELWYTGMPGAGKSTMASIIIERMINLQRSFNPSGLHGRVAFVYLSHSKNYQIDQLLGSIIQQVVKIDKVLDRSVTDLYTEFVEFVETEPSRKKTHGLANLLHRLSTAEPIYVVIDAIDEIETDLANDLISLVRPRGQSSSGVSLLVTSRIWAEFEHFSEGFQVEPITANSRDLQLYVDHMFRNHHSLQKLARDHFMIRNEVRNLVTWKCQQIFLLAKLQVQALVPIVRSTSLSHDDLREELSRLLPAALDLDEMYAKLSGRILREKEKNRDTQRAYRILAWVVLSPRQLRLAELREAMGSDHVTKGLGDPTHQSTQDTMRDICEGLITFCQGQIRLVHYTTQVYFSENADRLFTSFQPQIAQICASYLCTQDLESRTDLGMIQPYPQGTAGTTSYTIKQREELQKESTIFEGMDGLKNDHLRRQLSYAGELLERFPLLPYTLQFLGYHLRKQLDAALGSTDKNVISLLKEGQKMAFLYRWLRMLNLIQPSDKRRRDGFVLCNFVNVYPDPWRKNSSTGHASTYFPQAPSDEFAQGTDNSSFSDSFASSDDTPTTEELDEFLCDIMRHLGLDSRCVSEPHDPKHDSAPISGNEQDGEDLSAFISAAESLQSPTALPDQIQEGTLDPTDAEPGIPSTPQTTSVAGQAGRLTTPTHLAAWYGYVPVLQHFLKAHKDLDSADEFNRRPIVVALQQGHTDAVSACLDHGAQIDLTSTEGQEILLQVSRGNDSGGKLVRSIIRQNHDRLYILQQSTGPGVNNFLKLPMFIACIALVSARHFSAPIDNVFRMMHYGNSIIKLYRRLNSDNILAAAGRGDGAAIARMVAKGEWNVMDKDSRLGMMSIFVAVEFGSVGAVTALINGGVDVNIRDFNGNTPLIRAASRGNKDMVEALLARDANVKLWNHRRLTAWTVRLEPGNEEVLNLLEASGGADENATYGNGEPVLYCHAAGGNLAFVEWLLERGVNPSARTCFGWAPLHWAASNGHLECVEALLRKGAEPSPLSDTSKTPLDLARSQGRTQIIRVLETSGAISGRNHYERANRFYVPFDWNDICDDSTSQSSVDLVSEGQLRERYRSRKTSAKAIDDEVDIMHAQVGFEAALRRLEQKPLVPASSKKAILEFFFRNMTSVIRDIEDFNEETERWLVSDAASRKWDVIVQSLKERGAITKILQAD